MAPSRLGSLVLTVVALVSAVVAGRLIWVVVDDPLRLLRLFL